MNEHASSFTRYSFGPHLYAGGVEFGLWAPAAKRVDLLLDGVHAMHSSFEGWFELKLPGCGAGARYQFRIDDELDVPDPASHFQPRDVFGPSEVVDHNEYLWQADEWRGMPWEEAVILELHVGTVTRYGTYSAMLEKLDHFARIGITAIELMPLADFAGSRNWGYDGVLLYAPDSIYGHPTELKALIDAAHRRGLMVFLDVVYNHFGPEGNFLPRYAPQFFCAAQTPWGSAIDYRVPEVRAFAIENALHWLERYRFDGLRLDAVHAIVEPGEPGILQDLSSAVAAVAARTGRHIHLVLENDDNSARLLRGRDGVVGLYRAQWNDDYHHAWHVLLTGESGGYYKDYSPNPLAYLERTLASGFAYQGEPSRHRDGRPRGEPSAALPPVAFVNFLQNHDQVGNRALGERLTVLASEPSIAAALAITLLAPMTPLLFMGEEWGSSRPFPFFCDFQGDLADAVRRGRRAEFRGAYEKYGHEVPDPLAMETFESARLDWDSLGGPRESQRLEQIRELLQVRRSEISPRLAGAAFDACTIHGTVASASWRMGDGRRLRLVANLGAEKAPRPAKQRGRAIYGGEPQPELPPWSVFWSLE
jgi:maltooligosyltrehalose trehalohydrolase